MILAADIGNTNIVLAFFKDNKWSEILRIETLDPPEKCALEISNFILEHNIDVTKVKGAVLSSVVPSKTSPL